MDSKFFDSLFEGDSPNGAKLGMGLTCGDFWPRIAGCLTLYRGGSVEAIDFNNILAVAEPDAKQVSPPSYVAHGDGTTYFYVLRRANNCGQLEYTLSAAVKVSIDANGELSKPRPNSIFEAGASQVAGSKVELLWFYSPLGQNSKPVFFKICTDDSTGQVDYENPTATISYVDRKFYSYQTDALEACEYLFVVKVEDVDGEEDSSLSRLKVQLDVSNPGAIDIVDIGAV